MLLLSSIILSLLIITLGVIQGKRCFGSYRATTLDVQDMGQKLKSCAEGISFKEVLGGWVDDPDPIIRRIGHSLTRLFTKEPLRLHGNLGWVVDLDGLCDAKYWARQHRGYGALESMPGLLTGAGILFTFLGLTVGVYGLDPTNAEQLTAGVKRLLGGMSMAFLTSIAGIGTALWWTWRNKLVLHDFEEAFANLSEILHDKSFLLIPEEMNYELLDLISDQKTALDNIGPTMADALRQVLNETGLSQRAKTKDSSKDISQDLAELKQELAHISRGYAENGEINRKLNHYLNTLVRREAEPTTAAQAVANPELLVRETGHALANLGKISQVQGDTVAALTEATQEFQRLMAAMQTAGSDMARHHGEISSQFSQMDEHWNAYRNQLHNLNEGLKHSIAVFGKELDGTLTNLHGEFDSLMADSLKHFATALKDFEVTIESFSMVASGSAEGAASEPNAPASRRRNLLGRNK